MAIPPHPLDRNRLAGHPALKTNTLPLCLIMLYPIGIAMACGREEADADPELHMAIMPYFCAATTT